MAVPCLDILKGVMTTKKSYDVIYSDEHHNFYNAKYKENPFKLTLIKHTSIWVLHIYDKLPKSIKTFLKVILSRL